MIRFENWEDTPKADDSVAALTAEMAQRLLRKGTNRMTPEERIEAIARRMTLSPADHRAILNHLRLAAQGAGEHQPEDGGPFGDHAPPDSGAVMESAARTPSARDLIFPSAEARGFPARRSQEKAQRPPVLGPD